jgi:peroxiredoxin
MAAAPPVCDFGAPAPDFALPDLEGNTVRLADVRGENGTLILFICNHCPCVKSVIGRIVEDAKALQAAGIGVAAIMSNDYRAYPADAPDKMRAFATEHGFPFPYLLDESQAVARAYDAVCTPDFFGYDADLGLQYRGRLDESKTVLVPNARRELKEAMLAVAETGKGPADQTPSMGCSIKWKAA